MEGPPSGLFVIIWSAYTICQVQLIALASQYPRFIGSADGWTTLATGTLSVKTKRVFADGAN